MSTQSSQKRFALLVGVDLYLDDKSGTSRINNLEGCINDVQIIKELLNKFEFHKLRTLTSSLSSESRTAPCEPRECWPTYENIKNEFLKVTEEANAGDLFFFHFSGHGARLKTAYGSSGGRTDDPSLLPMDVCCGKPAVRGWELNDWLQTLNRKGVQVVVSLDSCYSAGAWRNEGSLRSPTDWIPPPSLSIGEAATRGPLSEPNNRHGQLDISWDINPEMFTMMAACGSQQAAAEKAIGGRTYGVFTHALCTFFEENQAITTYPTYRTVHDSIERLMSPQTPQFYGRVRLAFLGQQEPFSVAPVVATVDRNIATLPVGKLHGVEKGAEFRAFPPTTAGVLSIFEVGDVESKAKLSSASATNLVKLFPHRWSSGKISKVSVQAIPQFQKTLYEGLVNKIASGVEVGEVANFEQEHDPSVSIFRLAKTANGGIDISGPSPLMGYEGPVRGLEIKGESDDAQAQESAIALSHLVRFEQILKLRDYKSSEKPPFKVTIETLGEKKKFRFENQDKDDLHFTVINLGPGFHIGQLYPADDHPKTIPKGETDWFSFCLSVPDELERDGTGHRDIIRTVVTRHGKLLCKTWELPDIWNAKQAFGPWHSGPVRKAELVEDDLCWWMQDDEFRSS
ncbi:caspase domain-containing protein [Annulohypoxylon maeteangense]|uniref:caspase domain-containing protein n=1 Tax=Annulohypoxylon maeteangense TaxID=1927788 RepID=UPI0020084E13|nr:caspase domain-containing protein [Annulohypoxylon maeteangense]KAI0887518.1 caspase domain-containing protein [Annulohypoxylon maeteangense]